MTWHPGTRLVADLATLRPGEAFPWRHLRPELRRIAEKCFRLSVHRDWRWARPVRVAHIPDPRQGGRESSMPDVRWVSEYGDSWQLGTSELVDPDYHRWRVRQVCANAPLLAWHLRRNEIAGRPLHIVGFGPSAHDAARLIPPRHKRRSAVLALNRALELVEPDYWMVVDALRPGNVWSPSSWLGRTGWSAVARRARRARVVLSAHASHEIARRVCAPSFYLGSCQEHRDLVRADIQATLPTLLVGTQGLVGALHLAWWLGADPIIIWGCDQGVQIDGRSYYADGDGSQLAEPGWTVVPGVRGLPVKSTRAHAWCAMQAAAVALWACDDGRRVWNASRGLDYGTAIYMPGEDAAAAAEEMAR